MYEKPNTQEKPTTTKAKNDLYRKFRSFFVGATEKEFGQFDLYGTETYVSVDALAEEKLFDSFSDTVDEIIPLVGPTGIGKTYLLLYCLKSYYKINNVPANNPVILEKDGHKDLIYYSDFNVTERTILEEPTKLNLAKMMAIHECVSKHFKKDDVSIDVNKYIESNKLEVKYYSEKNLYYQKVLYNLTNTLNMDDIKIRNIVFIFDDLESLTEKQQYDLMEDFLILFENLKSKSNGKYHLKFMFCLRNNTYYNIYKKDFYNTHRANRALYIVKAPSLSELFSKRCDTILKSEKVKAANNEKSWEQAKEILISISDRVDNSYNNLLLNLNNSNISNALDDFLNILSNRRWTQKNVNPAASFMIEENDYYINDTNIMRILSMGEKNIYYQTMSNSLRCILPDPGRRNKDDLISLIVLRAFRFRSLHDIESASIQTRLLSADVIKDILTICLLQSSQVDYSQQKESLNNLVNSTISYYKDNRFIRKNVDPLENLDENKYFMLPRGEQIFDLFFSKIILFTIFRDTYIFNNERFDTRCSYKMSFNDLIFEAFKYEELLIDLELKLFRKIQKNNRIQDYISLVGEWSFSENFLEAINKSAVQFYKGKDAIPQNISVKIEEFKQKTLMITGLFKEKSDANDLF